MSSENDKKNSLFADIQKGLSISLGLNKTDKTQQSKAPAVCQAASQKPKPKTQKPDGPEALIKEGTFVILENFAGSRTESLNKELTEADLAGGKHVHVQNCEFVNVHISGAKIKSLTVDNCKKVKIHIAENSCDPTAPHSIFGSNGVTVFVETGVPKVFSGFNSSEIVLLVKDKETAKQAVFKSTLTNGQNLEYTSGDDQLSIIVPPYSSISRGKDINGKEGWIVQGDLTVL